MKTSSKILKILVLTMAALCCFAQDEPHPSVRRRVTIVSTPSVCDQLGLRRWQKRICRVYVARGCALGGGENTSRRCRSLERVFFRLTGITLSQITNPPTSGPTMPPTLSPTDMPSASPSDGPTVMPTVPSPVFTSAEASPAKDGLTLNLAPQGSTTADNAVCGPVQSVLTHPTNPDICFAGAASGGVWRTKSCTAASPEWIPLTDNEFDLSVNDMVFDESDDTYNTIVVVVGRRSKGTISVITALDRAGLLKTTNALADDNVEWEDLGRNGSIKFESVYANGDLILATGANLLDPSSFCSNGLFRSTDSGDSWTQVYTAISGLDIISDPDPDNSGRFYASAVAGLVSGCPNLPLSPGPILVSEDFGQTWTGIENQPVVDNVSFFLNGRVKLALSEGYLWVYAFIKANRAQDSQLVVAFSVDGGGSWTDISPSHDFNNYLDDMSLLAQGNIAYIGAEGTVGSTGFLFRGDATVQGGGWESLTVSSAPHRSSRDMALRADGAILEGNGGGIVVRTKPNDNTGDWFGLCSNLQVFETTSVAYEPIHDTILFGGTTTGSILGTLGVQGSYASLLTGPGNFVMIDSTSDSNNIYYYFSGPRLTPFVRVTKSLTDNSTTTEELTVPTTGPPRDRGVAEMNPANGAQFAMESGRRGGGTVGENSIAFTTDSGNTFQTVLSVHVSTSERRVRKLAWAHDGSVLYTSDGGNALGACPNDGTTLSCMLVTSSIEPTDPNNPNSGRNVHDLAVDPSDPQVLLAIVGGFSEYNEPSIYRTTDGGVTWSDVTVSGSAVSNPTARGASVAFMDIAGSTAPPVALVGVDADVYVEEGGIGNGWKLLATGIPNALIIDMKYDATDDILIVATLGRGVWFLKDASEALS